MREKKLYTCEICNTDYSDKGEAIQCEKSHKLLEKATIVGEYHSVGMVPSGETYKDCPFNTYSPGCMLKKRTYEGFKATRPDWCPIEVNENDEQEK